MKGKLIPPYTRNEKQKNVIDWDTLGNMYLHQGQTAKEFLEQFRNIDLTKKKTIDFLKKFELERNKRYSKSNMLRRNLKELTDNNLIDETTLFKHIETLKKRQAISDHEAIEKLRHALMAKVNNPNVTTNELAMISKAMEICQKIQRIALGMEGNETGQESLSNKPEEDKTNVETPENVPTFVVEMNDNGKFKRLKPRRVK